MRILCWNVAGRADAWPTVAEAMAAQKAQVALLQEAPRPPSDWWTTPSADGVWAIEAPLAPGRHWRSCIAAPLGNPDGLVPVAFTPIGATNDGDLACSHPGQFAVVEVPWNETQVRLVSLYGIWEWMKPVKGSGYAVPSVHRAISDLTRLWFGDERPVIIAGDFNIWRGEGGWADQYDTVFTRMQAEGFTLAGPFGPGEANQATHSSGRQDDFVFARNISPTCEVLALRSNSDHFPLRIDLP